MFVAMGLSAVFPVFHGVMLFGIHNMQERMGLYWLLLQGVFYITGAGLYGVSIYAQKLFNHDLTESRRASPKDNGQEPSTYGEVLIRFFMSWWLWRPRHTCMDY
jgi:predicted membrane channel-forming protein YqfA (hemolysin III family)